VAICFLPLFFFRSTCIQMNTFYNINISHICIFEMKWYFGCDDVILKNYGHHTEKKGGGSSVWVPLMDSSKYITQRNDRWIIPLSELIQVQCTVQYMLFSDVYSLPMVRRVLWYHGIYVSHDCTIAAPPGSRYFGIVESQPTRLRSCQNHKLSAQFFSTGGNLFIEEWNYIWPRFEHKQTDDK